jgi:signal transduction histidine kinase
MWSAALAAGVTGLLVHPLGVRLAKGVDRMFYGDRSDPALVLSRLLSGLRESLDIWEVPAAVCHGVVDSLRLGAATLSLGEQPDAPAIASVGDVSGPAQRLELRHRGETVGTLTVTPRPGERGLDTRDVELLLILADQVAPAIAALRLHESLQQSRAALVTAREEERRRLRRDLHDGIGAALAGIRLQLESARELVDDRTAGGLIDAAVGGVSDAVGDLRGITEDLRPPVLEDLGLEGAVVSLTERLSTPGRRVVVDMGELGELPAAVEVASYRIIAEALANAARHSGATDVAVGLVASGHVLKVVVSDNGCGLPQQIRPGALGLTSMRSRAEELGGELTVRSTGSGTEIAARLPWRMT